MKRNFVIRAASPRFVPREITPKLPRETRSLLSAAWHLDRRQDPKHSAMGGAAYAHNAAVLRTAQEIALVLHKDALHRGETGYAGRIAKKFELSESQVRDNRKSLSNSGTALKRVERVTDSPDIDAALEILSKSGLIEFPEGADKLAAFKAYCAALTQDILG